MKKEIKKGYNEPNQTDDDISSELIKALEKLLLDVEDGRNKNPNNEEIKIKRAMKELIEILSKDINSFDVNGFLKKLEDYLAEYKRLLYSEVSVYIYAISSTTEKKRLNVLENMNNTFNYQLKKDEKIESALTKVVIKLWDHINLAINQYNELKINDESFQKRIQPVIDQINENKKELQDSKKELYSQLIGIVSIFVAISFVMFGGMSLLNNLFDYSEMKSIPLLEMICGGSLIGIIMITVIYAFIVFVLRLTGKFEKIDYEVDSNKIDTLTKLDEKLEERDSWLIFKLIKIVINGRNKIKHPYRRVVTVVCCLLTIIGFAAGKLWVSNVRGINDVKSINTQCEVIEQNEESIIMSCPLDMGEANKIEANQVESSKDESDKSEVNKIESNKDKVTKNETNKDKVK
jgi:hypothetical protein